MKGNKYLQYVTIKSANHRLGDTQNRDIYRAASKWNSGRTHVHMFHEKPTFYFSPVDRHLYYGDLKTLGDVQELHIKSPVTGMIRQLLDGCTETYC